MFEVDHCGCYCRVGWYEDADTVNLVVTHGSIVRTTPILQGDEERVISYRAAENAVLSYSAATGRIKIGGGTPLRRSALAELFADKMLGRSGFFAGPDAQNLYTLAPIERIGCGFAFNHAFDPAIRQVRIVEAQADQLSRRPVHRERCGSPRHSWRGTATAARWTGLPRRCAAGRSARTGGSGTSSSG